MIYLELFITFFKIGLFTIGGGYAMLPLIRTEVEGHGWLEKSEILNFIAVSESTPGPFAINIATYVGIETGGLFGAFCTTLGVVMPSFIIILVIAKYFAKFKDNKIVQQCMTGLKPAVVGLIGTAVLSIAKEVIFPDGYGINGISFYISIGLAMIMSILAFKKVHPVLIICISAVVGIISGYAFNL